MERKKNKGRKREGVMVGRIAEKWDECDIEMGKRKEGEKRRERKRHKERGWGLKGF